MNNYEFIGLIIGDGSILYNPKKRYYRLEIAGNATEDLLFFEEIKSFIFYQYGVTSKVRTVYSKLGKGIRLYLDNKKFVEYLKNEIGLPSGNKTFNIKIPEKYVDWNYSKYIIRGIFESDGCLCFSKSRHKSYPDYPRLEIKTSSKNLVDQLMTILVERGFKIRKTTCNNGKTFKIYLSGNEMLNKWISEIGFSHPKTIVKYNFWKTKGFYVPNIPFSERFALLSLPMRSSPSG